MHCFVGSFNIQMLIYWREKTEVVTLYVILTLHAEMTVSNLSTSQLQEEIKYCQYYNYETA